MQQLSPVAQVIPAGAVLPLWGLSGALGLCQPLPRVLSAGLGPGRNAGWALPEVPGLFPGTFVIGDSPWLEPFICSLEMSNW